MTQQGANYSATFDPSWVTPLHTNQTFDASRSLDISLTQTYFLLQSVQLALGGFLESSLHQVDPVGCQKNTLGAALVAVCHPRNLIGPHPCSVLCPLAQNRDSTPHPGGVLWSVVLFAAMVTVPEAGRVHRRTTERYPVVEAEAEAQRPDVTERKTSAGPRVPLPMLQEAQRSVALASSQSIVIEKLTKNVTESHLREIFGGFGDIQSLDLPMNKAFMTNRGTAYILYHDPADAEAAIAHMHEAQLDGATLNVSIVLPRRAFSRSPPPVQHSRASFGRPGHGRGPPSDSRAPRSPPPARKYRRSRHMERHDIYRPRSLSRSRSPRRSRSLSSKSRSTSPPPRRTHSRMDSSQRRRRRSPSYSSYGYSSRSDRERSASLRRDHH
ncbi:hypothetical protein AtubIFM57143_009589 [Aspergillus tubingensis]|nr:hypothetical protein AtubIFM57143_009589 [Aspergillus tubingensis]